jgi:hypothetical protein
MTKVALNPDLIGVIFFDFFATLIFWTQPLHVTIRKIADRYQLRLDWSVYDEARAILTETYEIQNQQMTYRIRYSGSLMAAALF